MKIAFLTISLFIASSAGAANNAVNDACRRLCAQGSECIKKCVSHAELFELRADFINAAADFNPSVETRMKVLRSGASLDNLSLCKQTGWSMDNVLVCLRSYPTPEVIKSCKKLSPLEEEQVRCVRSGKTSAEVETCELLFVGTDQRLRCIGLKVTAQETRICRKSGWNSHRRMECLLQAEQSRMRESRIFEMETRDRLLSEEKFEKSKRNPASN